MPQPATKTQPVNRGWTPERRARQSARIKIWAPWTRSTGPRTAAGKKRSSQNARRENTPERRLARALRAHGRYLSDLDRYIALEKIAVKNELLKRVRYNLRRKLLRQGRKVTIGLYTALIHSHPAQSELDRNKPADCLKRP